MRFKTITDSVIYTNIYPLDFVSPWVEMRERRRFHQFRSANIPSFSAKVCRASIFFENVCRRRRKSAGNCAMSTTSFVKSRSTVKESNASRKSSTELLLSQRYVKWSPDISNSDISKCRLLISSADS